MTLGNLLTSQRIWFLQMLRAFAIMGVIYSHVVSGPWADTRLHAAYAHVRPVTTPDLTSGWEHPLLWPYLFGPFSWLYHLKVEPGAFGVALFFLISGALIPAALDRHRPGGFLITRVFRLYPAWIASLAVAAIWFVGYAVLAHHSEPSFGTTTWMVNAAQLNDFTPSLKLINPVVWTLLIEWKFYLICAVLAWLKLLHRPIAILSVAVALAAIAIAAHHQLVNGAHGSSALLVGSNIAVGNAPFICLSFVGVCIHHWLTRRWSVPLCAALTAVVWILMTAAFRYGSMDADTATVRIHSTVAAGILFFAAFAVRRRLPYSRFLNWVADISYPLYAVHYLLGVGVMFTVFRVIPIPVVAEVVSVAVTVTTAALLHRFVERPANAFGKRLASRRLSR